MVLVDTSVWSLALRRARANAGAATDELTTLITDGRALIIGPIRQELLSGIRDPEQYATLRRTLRAFPDVPLETADHEEAAGFFNRCRSRGIQGSNTDLLICAVAARRDLAIFTADRDFAQFARVVPIHLHEPATGRRHQ